jgi:hypothetical protein
MNARIMIENQDEISRIKALQKESGAVKGEFILFFFPWAKKEETPLTKHQIYKPQPARRP